MTESHVFDAIDPDLASRIVARRDLFRSSALKLGALASAPMMLATVSSEAFGQSLPRQIVDILNYALTLEYLESSFYRVALDQADLIPSHALAVFQTIGKHGAAHVSTLKNALGSAAVETPNFDFTAGGKYADVFQSRVGVGFGIFSAAIQDYGRGVIVGEPSFGKGTVQTVVDLDQMVRNSKPEFGELKVTIAQFFPCITGSPLVTTRAGNTAPARAIGTSHRSSSPAIQISSVIVGRDKPSSQKASASAAASCLT